METLTHTSTTSNRKLLQLLMASLTAFLLVLSIAAPGADAQTRDTKKANTAVLAATQGCPDGFVDGRFGCVPENLTTKPGGVDDTNGCHDKWVVSSAPGGCSPEFLTLKLVGLEFNNGCPDGWVVSSAPGGCSPGFITTDDGSHVFAIQHHCAFGSACDAVVDAVLALGGHCTSSSYGETCTLPTGPQGRD